MAMKMDRNQGQCLCDSTDILVFPCPGGSNVGQITNEAAKELTARGLGKMYFLAGIGGQISGIIETTRAVKKIVAIDGRSVECAKKTLAHAGFISDVHRICIELGIKKNHSLSVLPDDVEKIINQIARGI